MTKITKKNSKNFLSKSIKKFQIIFIFRKNLSIILVVKNFEDHQCKNFSNNFHISKKFGKKYDKKLQINFHSEKLKQNK
jgi:hypothetical protein